MATFEKRGNAWRAVISLKGKRKSATFDTRAEAMVWAKKMEDEKAAGTLRGSGDTQRTVADLLEAYMKAVTEDRDTARSDRLRILRWMREPIAKMRLIEVTREFMDDWVETEKNRVSQRTGKQISPSSVQRELNLLSGAFTYATGKKWIEDNPCHGLKRLKPVPPRNRPLLTEDEIEAILIATGYHERPQLDTKTSRVGAMFLLAMETGMRSGELLRLRADDVFLDKRMLIVRAISRGGRKGGKSGYLSRPASRQVPLTDNAALLLEQLMSTVPEDQTPSEDQPYVPYIIGLKDSHRDGLWRKALKKSGVRDLTFHDTKHEACTRLAQFCDIFALSHAVGTKDLSLLRDTYYSSDAERLAKLLPNSLVKRRPRLRVVGDE